MMTGYRYNSDFLAKSGIILPGVSLRMRVFEVFPRHLLTQNGRTRITFPPHYGGEKLAKNVAELL